MSSPITGAGVPATSRRNKHRRRKHHNHFPTPTRNPPKTRVGNGRVLSNGAGLGSDKLGDFFNPNV